MEFVAAIEPSRQSSRYISIGIHSEEQLAPRHRPFGEDRGLEATVRWNLLRILCLVSPYALPSPTIKCWNGSKDIAEFCKVDEFVASKCNRLVNAPQWDCLKQLRLLTMLLNKKCDILHKKRNCMYIPLSHVQWESPFTITSFININRKWLLGFSHELLVNYCST